MGKEDCARKARPRVNRSTLPRDQLTVEYLKSILEYHPATGEFTWLPRDSNRFKPSLVGTPAGYPKMKGRGKIYHHISIREKSYLRSRLAFFYMEGRWPEGVIDHKDGDSLNDSWGNLRDIDHVSNCENRKGRNRGKVVDAPLGVSWNRFTEKYVARIGHKGKLLNLGGFDSAEEAEKVYIEAKRRLHGGYLG